MLDPLYVRSWGEGTEKVPIDKRASTAGSTCKSFQGGRASFEEPLVLIPSKQSKKDFSVEAEPDMSKLILFDLQQTLQGEMKAMR